jgi:hypothetical protein
MYQKSVTLTVCIVVCFMLTSCSSKEIPQGFPKKLANFQVTLLNEGQPVHNAVIVFVTEIPSSYNILGLTNLNGVTKPKTTINTYSKSGIPPATYHVTITHTPKAPSEVSNTEFSKMSYDEIVAYRKKIETEIAAIPHPVPKEWGNIKTTPVKIIVPEKGGSVAIEITDPKTFIQ